MKFFHGNYTAFLLDLFGTTNASEFPVPEYYLPFFWAGQQSRELEEVAYFYMGIFKSAGFPIGLLLQVLTVVYLVRGNSGYSKSAKNWFLLVLGGDIGSTLYRLYDLISVDFRRVNPFVDQPFFFGQYFLYLIWGLRTQDHKMLQNVMCRVFFILLYFPIFLSPISLTMGSLIRSYCVKFPLKAKATLTTRVDRMLMGLSMFLSLAVSIIIGGLSVSGWSNENMVTAFDIRLFYGDCTIPRSNYVNTEYHLLFIGLTFMLTVVFLICAFSMLSAIIIIIVLFEAKKNRKSLSASDGGDSKAEIRATGMLLGMNVALFICFFVSRVMAVAASKIDYIQHPHEYVFLERCSSYLFNVPYFTNFLFVAGFTRKFYAYYLPCLAEKKVKNTSVASQKTMEESKMG